VGYVPREEVEAKKLLQLLEFFMLLKYLLPDGEVFLQIYETIEQLLLHFPNSHFQKSTQILLHQLGYI
jgi:hypothetical protein